MIVGGSGWVGHATPAAARGAVAAVVETRQPLEPVTVKRLQEQVVPVVHQVSRAKSRRPLGRLGGQLGVSSKRRVLIIVSKDNMPIAELGVEMEINGVSP